MPIPIRERAVTYAASVLRRAKDWQEAQHALADHATYGPSLTGQGDPLAEAQAIIREAEEHLGDALPY